MSLLPLIVVMVVGSGGPSPTPGEHPNVLNNSTVKVRREGSRRVIASSHDGVLRVRLSRGTYRIEAVLYSQGYGSPPSNCEAKTIHINNVARHPRARTVKV